MNEEKESIFLSEYLMLAACLFAVITSVVSLFFIRTQDDSFAMFEVIVKLVTVITMYLAYKKFSWDVAKGLMGGVLFCLIYQEAYLVLGRLWGEADFDTYLVVGIQGSLYLAAAGMSFLMTIVITINHFFINYGLRGNPKNVIFNRMSIIFKFAVYILLLVTNSRLGLSSDVLWENAFEYLTDMAILLLIVSIESQFDSFKVLRHELLKDKREKRKGEKDK
ncbi:hypothetical protein [Butyrivibrio sp. JL13D10]|uniref:hypothetical protein n=1 Tax=Butyrivibrio sp. JL13D10 TaxID=3236815 RepID=UPI0038B52C72